jgi:hypothetical protein
LTALFEGGRGAFDDFGGVGPYVFWCYTAGTLGGATVGVARRFLDSGMGLAMVAGLVTAEAFGSQFIMLWQDVDPSVAWFVVPMFFVVGAAMSPLARRTFATWPDVDRLLGRPAAPKNPERSHSE